MTTAALIAILFNQNTLFCLFALLGFFSHYLKKYAKREIHMSLYKYLFKNNPAASMMAVIALIMSIAITIGSGLPAGLTITQLAVSGFMTGYVSDSIFNNAADKASGGGLSKADDFGDVKHNSDDSGLV